MTGITEETFETELIPQHTIGGSVSINLDLLDLDTKVEIIS